MEDIAIGNMNNHKQRFDIFNKLNLIFEGLTPPIESSNKDAIDKNNDFISHVVSKQKLMATIKDQLSLELYSKGDNFIMTQSVNPDEQKNMDEPLTAGTILHKGSMGTLESEFTADNSFMTQNSQEKLFQEKHLQCLLKMLDTILFLFQESNNILKVNPNMETKICQTDQTEGCMIENLSSAERRRLSLEQRIRARKNEVEDTNKLQKDQQLKSLQYQIDMIQQKLSAVNDEKKLAEMKIQEQELNIQEQFEIINDYSNEIQDHNLRNKTQLQRIKELEIENARIIEQRDQDNKEFIEMAKIQKQQTLKLSKKSTKKEKLMKQQSKLSLLKTDKDDASSYSSDEEPVKTKKKTQKAKDSSQLPSQNEKIEESNELTDDLLKLQEDMAWINLQIDETTPIKENDSDEIKCCSNEQPNSSDTPSETQSTPCDTPNETGEKGHLKKTKESSKGQFEFPEGGWECSKCQNYNFKGRKECNRCKKPKTVKDTTGKPIHMKTDEKESPFKLQKERKTMKIKSLKIDTQQPESTDKTSAETLGESPFKLNQKTIQTSFKEPKRTHERAGDWICQRCNNHNFSFRQNCNMCHISHELSNQMSMMFNKQGAVGDMPLRMPSKKNFVTPLAHVQQPTPQSASERVVHVHQYFNTYTVPQNQSQTQLLPATLMGNASIAQPSPAQTPVTPTLMSATQIAVSQASPAQVYACPKTGQKLPQWRPSNPQTGSSRQIKIE